MLFLKTHKYSQIKKISLSVITNYLCVPPRLLPLKRKKQNLLTFVGDVCPHDTALYSLPEEIRDIMSGPQCCANPPTLSSSTGSGSVIQLGGLNAYVTGPSDSKLAILLISDVFGDSPFLAFALFFHFHPFLYLGVFFIFLFSVCFSSLNFLLHVLILFLGK